MNECKNCIVNFLCRDTNDVEDLLLRCDLIDKHIYKEAKRIWNSDKATLENFREIILNTFESICTEINHPYKSYFLGAVLFHLVEPDGIFYYYPDGAEQDPLDLKGARLFEMLRAKAYK